MSLMKRATAQLIAAGLPHLEVRKGMYGYSVRANNAIRQRSTVFKTPKQAIEAAINGTAPEVIIARPNQIKRSKAP